MTQSIVHPESEQSLDSLRKVLYKLQAATSLDVLCEVVSSYVYSHLGYELVWLGVYDSGAEMLEGPWRICSEANSQSKSISILPGDLFDQVLLTRRTSRVPSLKEESRVGDWQPLAQKLKIQGGILQTIRYQKESMGVLLIGTTKWGVNSRQDESEQFTILANTIGATLKLLKAQTADISSCLKLPESQEPTVLALLDNVSQGADWNEQLSTLFDEVMASHPEYSLGLYLLDADRGDFESYRLHKAHDQRAYRSRQLSHAFPYHQNSSFFRLLEKQKSFVISDINSSVGVSVPASLAKYFDARSLLFQPIIVRQSLTGFWVMTHNAPLNWGELEKKSLVLMAKLVELTFPSLIEHLPSEESEGSLSHLNTCQLPVAQADEDEWDQGLKNWIISLTKQFQCQWSVWLSYDPPTNTYFPRCFFSTNHRTKLNEQTSFGSLSSVDEKLISRSDTSVALVDLKEDLRLVAWRDQLLSEGMQSVLMARLASGGDFKDVLLLGGTTARGWTKEESDDLFGYARQLYQAYLRRLTHQSMLQEKTLNNMFRQGFHTLQSTKSSQSFVNEAAQILINLCDVSGCMILLWSPSRQYAKVKALAHRGNDRLEAQLGAKVDLNDSLLSLISEAARSNHTCLVPVRLAVDGLSVDTQEWLSISGGQSLIGLPLQPQPKQSVFGSIVLLDSRSAALTDLELETLSDLCRYMAWVLCSSYITDAWRSDYELLHTTHWYQNKLLGHACKEISTHLKTLNPQPPSPHQTSCQDINDIVKRLSSQNSQLIPDIGIETQSVTLVRLLREIIDQLEPVFSSKQIWVQVHHLKQSNLALKTSKMHLSFVLDEVLKAATHRSDSGGRIDIWCRMNHPEWLDLSITDSGKFDPRFLKDIQLGHSRDRLKPSLLNEDSGQRLLACKTIVQKLGGKLDFLSLEDDRTLTRFTLPCVTQ